jgi:hypothetical protein
MNEDIDRMALAEPLAGDELERMLARYARVRLDPDPSQVRRARAAVMEDAWRQRLTMDRGRPVARRGLFSGWAGRRLGLSLTAAVFAGLLLGSTAFAASRAGGPLYETRLALETLGLPSGAAARVDSRIEAAQARLAEAVDAAGRHDSAATTAALDAYDRVIDELLSADGTAAARALEAVEFHHTVLLEIAGRVPDAAASGIERALANSERVIDRLNASVDAAGTPGAGSNGNAGGNGIGSPGGKPSPVDGGKPAATGGPRATPKPHPTANPPGKPEKSTPPKKAAPSSTP